MTLKKHLDTTWMYHFNKPENRVVLEEFRANKDYGLAAYIRLVEFVYETLYGTNAWNVSGVNKLLNKLTDSLIAKANKAKNGKSSAPAMARYMLDTIDKKGNEPAVNGYYGPRFTLKVQKAELRHLLETLA